MRHRWLLPVFLAAAPALAAAGCWNNCSNATTISNPHCDQTTGSATVTAPAVYQLSSAMVDHGETCIDEGGGCSGSPSFYIENAYVPNGYGFLVFVILARRASSYTLPSPDVEVSSYLVRHGDMVTAANSLSVVSGQIAVGRWDAGELRATFDMALATTSGEQIAVRGGTLDVSQCTVDHTELCNDQSRE